MAGEGLALDTDDADARALCRRGSAMPERSPAPPPTGHTTAKDSAELLEQLEGQRPLTGDDVGIVVGREVAQWRGPASLIACASASS